MNALRYILAISLASICFLSSAQENCTQVANKRLVFMRGFKIPYEKADYKHNDFYCDYAYNIACVYCFLNKDSARYYFKEAINCNPLQVEMLDDYFLKRIGFGFTKEQQKSIQDAFNQKYGKNKFSSIIYDMLRMNGADQSVRTYGVFCKEDAQLKKDLHTVDSANLIKAKAIFYKYGFPSISMVGAELSNDYFLFVQHADKDLPFQKKVLKSMDTLLKKREIKPENYAYLTDRVMVAETGKQLYGTQLNKNKPFPILDSLNVNMRRKELGMTSLEEYLKTFVFFDK